MWSEVVSQVDIGACNAPRPKLLLESLVEDSFGSTIASLIKLPDYSPLGGRGSSELNWHTAGRIVLSPPTLASEGSCTTSSSDYPGSPTNMLKATSPEKSELMKHPVTNSPSTHIGGNERDVISPPPQPTAPWTSMLLRSNSSQSSPSSTSAILELDTLNWSSNLSVPATSCDADEQFSEIPSPSSVITANRQQHLGAACLNAFVETPSTGSALGGVAANSIWSQVLLGGARSEAMQNLQNGPVEGLQDVLYSRAIRQGGEFLLSDHLKKFVETPAWGLPANSTFVVRGDEMNRSTPENPTSSLQYSKLVDDRLNTTSCGLSDIQTWSGAEFDHDNTSISQMKSLNAFTSGLDLSSMQFQESHVKQEHPFCFGCVTPTTTSSDQLQGFGSNSFKSDGVSSHQFSSCPNMPFLMAVGDDTSLACRRVGDEYPGRYASEDFSRFPPTLPQTFTFGSTSKQPAQILAFGSSLHRHSLDLSDLMRREVRHPVHGRNNGRVSPLQYVHGSIQGTELQETPSKLRPKVHADRLMNAGSDLKRHTALSNPTENPSEEVFKRPRVEPASAPPPPPPPAHASPSLPFKVRKEKLGDRITTLQQLVSPFGKTDTASVLLEAIGYIKFLQEQVQVLSAPYLKSAGIRSSQKDSGKKPWGPGQKQEKDDSPKGDLQSRGLCLVPVSYTLHVANDNGADYWSSAVGGGLR